MGDAGFNRPLPPGRLHGNELPGACAQTDRRCARGPIAEIRGSGDLHFAGALGDIGEITTNAQALAGAEWPALVFECEEQSRALVSEHWTAIRTVAEALASSPERALDAETVRSLLGRRD
jgi:hypothetical protein